MPARKFSLLALFLLLCIAADPPRLHFLKPDDIDPVALLPGPPADDSEEHKKEIQTSLDWQEKRTPEQIARCKREEGMSAFGFDDILGDWFDAKNLPSTAKLIRQATGDAKYFVDEAKAHWNRTRPFDAIPAIHPCVAREQSPSFPSGHATRGMLWATILANLFPDDKDKLLAAGRQMGEDRVIGGAHYLSDVAAGQKLGTAIANKLLANPDFQKDLAAARQECAAQTHSGVAR